MGGEGLALPGAFYFTLLKKEVTRPSKRATENLFCFGTARKDMLNHLERTCPKLSWRRSCRGGQSGIPQQGGAAKALANRVNRKTEILTTTTFALPCLRFLKGSFQCFSSSLQIDFMKSPCPKGSFLC